VAINSVTLTLDIYDGTSSPVVSGTAFFTPTEAVAFASDSFYLWQYPIEVSLVPPAGAEDWLATVLLVATDNSGADPSGWQWSVEFQAQGAPPGFSFSLPYGSGADQNLSAHVPA
jgi:hypothetical protein